MEIKERLDKPCTDKQRLDFIVRNNHQKGYEIKETRLCIEAWGFTDDEEAEKELEDKKISARAVRNAFLQATDVYMIADFPISDEEREAYKGYREYLRNYTEIDNWYENEPLDFKEWKLVLIDSSDEVE